MVTRGHQSHAPVGQGWRQAYRDRLRPKSRHAATTSEQAGSAETRDWIGHNRHRLALEEPAGHREPKRREADVNDFHIRYLPDSCDSFPVAENRITLAKLSPNPRKVNEPKVPCRGTEVTGLGCGYEVLRLLRNQLKSGKFQQCRTRSGARGQKPQRTGQKTASSLTFPMLLNHNLG